MVFLWRVGDSHLLSNDLASGGPDGVQIGVPQFGKGLVLEPALVDEEAEDLLFSVLWPAREWFCGEEVGVRARVCCTYHTGPVLPSARFLGSPDDGLSDDPAVGLRDLTLLHLTRHTFLNQVVQAEGHLSHLRGWDGGLYVVVEVRRED